MQITDRLKGKTAKDVIKWAYNCCLSEPSPKNNHKIQQLDDVLHIGHRAYCQQIDHAGETCVKKTFTTSATGKKCFSVEKLANKRFSRYSWMSQWREHGRNWFIRKMFPDNTRIEVIAETMSAEDKLRLTTEALSIALDLYVEGFAHRDLHIKNLFLSQDGLKLVDFETLTAYPEDWSGSFWESHDIMGNYFDSFRPDLPDYHMGFAVDHPHAILNALDTSLEDARKALGSILKEELHQASLTFKTHNRGRHSCKAQRIYSTFDLPFLSVAREDAQRDCPQRFERFLEDKSFLKGKTIADLGSNIGGMLFAAQKFSPSECVGIEFDAEKVAVARRVAAFAGMKNVSFIQGNIDQLTFRSLGGARDIVFCLAINKHVKKPNRLYALLGKITGQLLLFEGNANTCPDEVKQELMAAGFSKVENLGFCDDDCQPENNNRLIFRAWK